MAETPREAADREFTEAVAAEKAAEAAEVVEFQALAARVTTLEGKATAPIDLKPLSDRIAALEVRATNLETIVRGIAAQIAKILPPTPA